MASHNVQSSPTYADIAASQSNIYVLRLLSGILSLSCHGVRTTDVLFDKFKKLT